MFKNKNCLFLLAILLVMALLAGGCATAKQEGNADNTAAEAKGTLNVYTSVPEQLINDITAKFQTKYPNLQVKVYRAGTPDVMAKLEAESKAGGVTADVVWVAETTSAEDLKELNMLRTYKSKESGAIPENLKDKDEYYYGSRLINMVIAYNTKEFKSPPETWSAFLDKSHQGKIGVPSPGNSGSALYAVGSLVNHADFGWKYFEDMRANGGVQLKNNNDAVQKVASNELHMAIALDYQVKNMRDGGSPIDYAVPKEGLVMVVSPIALLKDSPNPKGGEIFLDYVISAECQEFMSQSQSVVPVRTDVNPPQGIPSLEELKALSSDPIFIKKNKAEIVDKFGKIFTS